VLESLVYDITVRDTVSYVTALLLLLVTLAAATLWPARRALRLNPMDVIRTD
jgi:ABC-type lipoprotein release transport system permease subunit